MPFGIGKPFANFTPWNAVRKPASKTNFGFGLNSNDFEQQQLAETTRQQQLQQQQTQQPPSLADEYAKMTGNRPQRLAYQQAVEEGAPQISRGKWAKLGAMLAAGGSALGGTKAPDAVNMALSAYQEPQRRSDELYQKKMKGLGDLANMEESDMQEKLKVLELQNKDWYDQRAEKRAGEDQTMQSAESKSRIASAQAQMDKLNTDEWDDEATGLHWIRKPDGTVTSRKQKLTPEEEIARKKSETIATEEALNPGRIAASQRAASNDAASDARSAASSMANINRQGEIGQELEGVKAEDRQELELAKRESAVAKIRERAATMPDGVMKNMTVDMADEIAAGRLPKDASQYLQFDENGVATAGSGGMLGSSETQQKVKDFISRSINKNRNMGQPEAGRTQSGGKYKITEVDAAPPVVTSPTRFGNRR